MPDDLRYFENPYTGLLKEYHTGGLAVHFGAADGPPIDTGSAHELSDTA